MNTIEQLQVKSDAFEANGPIPVLYTGWGEDISPALRLSALSNGSVSLAVLLDDLDHPLVKDYSHWVLWNIPATREIPKNIPHGPAVEGLGGARQGMAYGRHRYRGPKPPKLIKQEHRYTFHVFVLNRMLDLPQNARKADLLQAMQGHILQRGSLTGVWGNTYPGGPRR